MQSLPQETDVYCFSEIYRALHRMSRALFKLRRSPARIEFAISILKMARKIRDLAMIHGYEGVENVACNFCRQFEAHSQAGSVVNDDGLAKIESWILSIKRMVAIEESEENNTTIETISSTLQREQLTALSPLPQNILDSENDDVYLLKPSVRDGSDVFFEIREYDDLLQVDGHKKGLR